MKWWQIRKKGAGLERELRSDLELGEEEQLVNSLSSAEGQSAAPCASDLPARRVCWSHISAAKRMVRHNFFNSISIY